MTQYFDVPELARRLSVCPNTARALVTSGEIEAIRVGNKYRISVEAFAEYCRSATVKRPRIYPQSRPLASVDGGPLKRIRL